LLGELQVAHCIVTLDALHCQRTFEAAAQAQARVFVQLKDNQPALLRNAAAACASRHPTSSDTTARSRHETRTVDVFSATRAVAATEWKSLIKTIVRVTRDVLHRNATTGLWSSTSEVAYYLANSPTSARQSAAAIRGHWHIENKLHYTRDVTFQEDQPRIRHNPGIFARLRSFAYNILRRNQTSSFSRDRYRAALAGSQALLKWTFS
jgi:predicted transposase YbfD/YdcC